MALPMLLGYDTIRDGNTLENILARYTCPIDGYIHAWQDDTDPNTVWLQPTCPVDSVKASLVIQIANFVNIQYNYTDQYVEPIVRLRAIFSNVMGDVSGWLTTHTTPAIALFLSDGVRLHGLIFAEMKKQGIVQ